MAILSIQNLGKKLGQNQILQNLSIDVQQGEIIALLGPSGSGKTTLLRCLSGLETPDSGSITLAGKDVFNARTSTIVPPERRNIGLVFQSYALWPHKTVQQNVAFGLELRKVPRAQAQQKVEQTLKRIGLDGLAERFPGELSGGQQQRVSLARAFVTDPVLLLLDEPLSNLDAKLREYARVWLREALKAANMTAVFVTHDQAEAMAIADRVAVLHNGQLAQIATPQELYENPNSLFIADFMGSPNILQGKVLQTEGPEATVQLGNAVVRARMNTPIQKGADCKLVLRPERLSVGERTGNSLQGKKEHSLYLGSHYEHWFEVGDERLRVHTPFPVAFGQASINFTPQSALVFPA